MGPVSPTAPIPMPPLCCSMALAVQLFLKMDRVDKAEQLAKVSGGNG